MVQTKRNLLEVRDLNVDLAQESLETRDRIIRAALAYNQLVVVTTLQLYIYRLLFLKVSTTLLLVRRCFNVTFTIQL